MRRYGHVNLGLDPERQSVHIYSGVGKWDKINLIREAKERTVQILAELPPIEVAVLVLGSNDLACQVEKTPEKIASTLIDLGLILIKNGIKRVAFVQCLPRFGWGAFKRFCTLDEEADVWTLPDLEATFEERFNEKLQEWVKGHDDMDFIVLRGLRDDVRSKFFDGLHLDYLPRPEMPDVQSP